MAKVLVHKNKQENHGTECVVYAVYYNMQDKQYYSMLLQSLASTTCAILVNYNIEVLF